MANTETSAVIRWNTHSNTGGNGISISQYGIMSSDSGLSLNTTVSDDMLYYNITEINYNTNYNVNVTAINSCDLKSEPANVLVNIEARGMYTCRNTWCNFVTTNLLYMYLNMHGGYSWFVYVSSLCPSVCLLLQNLF